MPDATEFHELPPGSARTVLGLCYTCLVGKCRHVEHPYEGGSRVLAETMHKGTLLCPSCAVCWILIR